MRRLFLWPIRRRCFFVYCGKPPDPELLVRPDAGKKGSPGEFQQIEEEKGKEYVENDPDKYDFEEYNK
jgi:hypothetical protein